MMRTELTKALVAARELDKAARRGALSPADAATLLALRSRQSGLHRALAAGTAALRAVRATAAPSDEVTAPGAVGLPPTVQVERG